MSLEIIIGPMFAGKSSALLSRIRRSRAIGKNVMVITSSLDNRYSVQSVTSHDKDSIPAISVDSLVPCIKLPHFMHASLIIVEEAQFFSDLRWFVEDALHLKKNLVLCGLDGDTEAKPFGQILDCIPLADSVVKMTALCELCADGTPAIFTGLRILGSKDEIISVGAAEKYIPLCRKHYNSSNGAK